jgi:hypothetical protein
VPVGIGEADADQDPEVRPGSVAGPGGDESGAQPIELIPIGDVEREMVGALRRGLTAERAAESLWLLSGPEAWNLAQRLEWPLRRYIDWYHRCARTVLLEEASV